MTLKEKKAPELKIFNGIGSYDKTLSYIFFKGLNKLIPAKSVALTDLSLVRTLTTRLVVGDASEIENYLRYSPILEKNFLLDIEIVNPGNFLKEDTPPISNLKIVK